MVVETREGNSIPIPRSRNFGETWAPLLVRILSIPCLIHFLLTPISTPTKGGSVTHHGYNHGALAAADVAFEMEDLLPRP